MFYVFTHIFRHLKLEIASAIPASNDQKNNDRQLSNTMVNRPGVEP